jgi:hypothetical protein
MVEFDVLAKIRSPFFNLPDRSLEIEYYKNFSRLRNTKYSHNKSVGAMFGSRPA